MTDRPYGSPVGAEAWGLFEVAALAPAGAVLVFAEAWPHRLVALAAGCVMALWVVRRAVTGRWTRGTTLDAPVLALLLTLPAAVTAASDLEAALSRVLALAFAVALYYALVNAVGTPRRAWWLVGALLTGGIGLAAAGLATTSWLTKYGPLGVVTRYLPGGRVVPHPTLTSAVHPNELAGLLVLFVPLALGCLLWPRHVAAGGTLRSPGWLRPLAVVSVLATAPTLLLTQSRGGWLALAAALTAMALAYAWKVWPRLTAGGGRRGALGAAAGLVALVVLVAVVMSPGGGVQAAVPGAVRGVTVASVTDVGRGRLDLWRDVVAMVGRAPLTGIGLNTFPLVFRQNPAYPDVYIYAGYPHAHNTLLQAAVDYGLPGLAAVAGLYAGMAWTVWRAYRRLADTPLAGALVGLAAGLLAHGLHGLVDAVAIGSKTGFIPWSFAAAVVALRLGAYRWTRPAPAAPAGAASATTSLEVSHA